MTTKTSKIIDSLTPAQEAKIEEYLEKYLKIGLSTEPTDRVKAEAALKASYAYQKLPEPEIIWADSPFEGIKIAAQLANGTTTPTKQQIADQASKASYASFESYWVSFYSFIAYELPIERDNLIDIVNAIIADCGVYWTFEDVIVVTEKPTHISMADGKLHSKDRKALEYKDGSGFYAINGTIKNSLLEIELEGTLGEKETA